LINYNFNPYVFVHLLTAIIALAVCLLVWPRRSSPGGFQLFLLMVAILEWALMAAFESAAIGQPLKIFWSKAEYIGVHTAPVFLFMFVLYYTNRERWLAGSIRWALFILPIATILLAATNEAHGWIWSGFSPGPVGTNSLIYAHGWWFWLEMIYVYFLVFLSTAVLLHFTRHASQAYRSQNLTLLVASAFPLIASIAYILELNPFVGLDLTLISFMFTGLAISIALLRFHFLKLIPIARELLIEQMSDGAMVVDAQMRIVDANTVARRSFDLPDDILAGQISFNDLQFHAHLPPCFDRDHGCRCEMSYKKGQIQHYELDVSPIRSDKKAHLGWLVMTHDMTERKKAELKISKANRELNLQLSKIGKLQHKLEQQASHDSLTGIFNRGFMEDTLIRELAKSKRENQRLALVIIDMDGFKLINDQFGHQAGDLILSKMGHLLKNHTRLSDVASRYGGDEFVMIMPGASAEMAARRVEEWRMILSTMDFDFKGIQLKPTFSAGVACFPENGGEIDVLMRSADNALYQAKNEGRNRVVIAH
jgi:diguanylate cyclase (GGDEF)-like protein/PAS domain S-box-containing protein